jgi:hypothetical protein
MSKYLKTEYVINKRLKFIKKRIIYINNCNYNLILNSLNTEKLLILFFLFFIP